MQKRWISSSLNTNNNIWGLEKDIRKGLDEQLGLEEIEEEPLKYASLIKYESQLKMILLRRLK